MTQVAPRIAYLLHRFPGNTDTFIKREIRALIAAGTYVRVISVWTPTGKETTEESLTEWRPLTSFLLPAKTKTVSDILAFCFRHPGAFCAGAWLAAKTGKPGVKGGLMQIAYFLEAVLAAGIVRQQAFTHIHNHIGDQSGTVTMLAAKMAGVSYSITFHGWPVFFDAENARVGEKVNRAVFTRSISYFCRSQLMLFARSRDPSRFKIVHCGIDIADYRFRAPRAEVKRLLCVARISYEKGLAFLIEAMDRLRGFGHHFELHLVGDGPDRAFLEELTKAKGLTDRVRFLGYLTEPQVRAELDAADVFILPSFVEGVPVSAMEAMAVGVPVIATNVGGTSELIEDGVSGLLIRPSDIDSLCDAIVRLETEPGLAQRIADAGRRTVVEEFDARKEFAKLNAYMLEFGMIR